MKKTFKRFLIFNTLILTFGLASGLNAQTETASANTGKHSRSKDSAGNIEQPDLALDTLFSFTISCPFTPLPLDGSSSVAPICNVFTPNNDNKNDVFRIESRNLKSMHCLIWNRWGDQMDEITSPDGDWTGESKSGNPCAEGVYYYSFNATGNDGVVYSKQGFVQLIR